jgi:N-acyl-D-aspartate/D-glutamate deacylase
MGLSDRGLLKEGFRADITIFNPQTVKEMGSLESPKEHPQGFEWVLVNGEVVLEKGRYTGALPGQVLRRREAR